MPKKKTHESLDSRARVSDHGRASWVVDGLVLMSVMSQSAALDMGMIRPGYFLLDWLRNAYGNPGRNTVAWHSIHCIV